MTSTAALTKPLIRKQLSLLVSTDPLSIAAQDTLGSHISPRKAPQTANKYQPTNECLEACCRGTERPMVGDLSYPLIGQE
jgi:hypothetical protein